MLCMAEYFRQAGRFLMNNLMWISRHLPCLSLYRVIREIYFAKRIAKCMLKSYTIVHAKNLSLSGRDLYKEVLLNSRQIDCRRVEQILKQVKDSTDLWTYGTLKEPGFRQIVHFLILSLYVEKGHHGATVSFRDIVYSLIPENL